MIYKVYIVASLVRPFRLINSRVLVSSPECTAMPSLSVGNNPHIRRRRSDRSDQRTDDPNLTQPDQPNRTSQQRAEGRLCPGRAPADQDKTTGFSYPWLMKHCTALERSMVGPLCTSNRINHNIQEGDTSACANCSSMETTRVGCTA